MINSIKNTTYYKGRIDQKEKNITQPSFKGNALSNALEFVESNPVVSLAMIDFLGMILPRTYIDLKRNKEELGHLNWDAARETILRESTTCCMLFFLPGLVAKEVGNLLLKNKFKKEGINTRSFVDYNTLEESSKKMAEITNNKSQMTINELRTQYVERMLDNATARIRQKEIQPDIKKSIKQAIIDHLSKPESIKKANISIENENPKQLFKEIEKYHDDFIKNSNISESIKNSLGETKVNSGKFSGSVDNFVKHIFTFADDLILKPAANVARDAGQTIKNGNEKIDLKAFNEQLDGTLNRLKHAKAIKLYTAFFTALSLLIAFPKVNMWISRKATGSDEFPGLKGLSDNTAANNTQNKKSGLFLFKQPEKTQNASK